MDLTFAELCDGYKLGHRPQFPKNTQLIFTNFTPRSSRVAGQQAVVFFGLQYLLTEFFEKVATETFFDEPKDKVIREYEAMTTGYLGPNNIGTDHIAALWDLGYLPLEVRARKEGSLVKLGTPMLTIHNTHHETMPEHFWVGQWLETLVSSVLWLPCTSATTAYRYRKLLDGYCDRQDGPKDFVPWQGHDFSFRGMSSPEAAILSGAAHLLSFTGTDTVPAVRFLREHYLGEGLIGGSVAATEHSVICAGGQGNEVNTLGRLLTELYPTGILSYVSDTWDLWALLTETLPKLRDEIMNRDGKLVIRPDSGDPVKIICGDPDATPGSPAFLGVMENMWNLFPGFYTDAGFKILDPHVGVIYGDSITEERCRAICDGLEAKGFAAANMVFGIGSYTYQYVTRDTYNFAIKGTGFIIDGQSVISWKDPITDTGGKKSARGWQAVDEAGELIDNLTYEEWKVTPSQLELVWKDGQLLREETLQDIRERLHG